MQLSELWLLLNTHTCLPLCTRLVERDRWNGKGLREKSCYDQLRLLICCFLARKKMALVCWWWLCVAVTTEPHWEGWWSPCRCLWCWWPLSGVSQGCHKGLGRGLWVFSQNAVTYRKTMVPLEVYLKTVNRGSEFSSATTKRADGWVVLVRSRLVMWRGDCIVQPPRVVAPSFQSLVAPRGGMGVAPN